MLEKLKKIGVKLAILAGVPVIGALLLSAHITREANERARSSEGIGSVEDLAELSARMTATIGELQSERALGALGAGFENPDRSSLVAQEAKTDAAVHAMDDFLAKRDLTRLPRRLGSDLSRARAQLRQLAGQREKLAQPKASIDDVLSFYGETNNELINASAALTQLSDDGELLRALSTLVATMQVKERSSREHAVLNNTFAHREFAPGLYRYFVTLVTEEAVYMASLKSLASDEQSRLFEHALEGPLVEKSGAMRKKALETTDDEFGIEAAEWDQTQARKVAALSAAERELAHRARSVAKRKVAETQGALAYSRNLVIAVVAVSLLLAWIIGRGISRSVLGLARVAGRVQKEQDFSLRAEKTSQDELGALTDAFNEMLSGIQVRDKELESHRENLEALVTERTRELSQRNEDMRLVLDTVDQGLVTLQKDGSISNERSRAFDQFFGSPPPGLPYYEHLAGDDENLRLYLKLDWEQLTEGILPIEVVLDQAKNRIERAGMHYALAYKPIVKDDQVTGALLMVSNVTNEMAARKAEAAQREQIKTIARVLKDRQGFLEFFSEARKLLERIRDDEFVSRAEKLRGVHTLKGNAALFDVSSVAEAAHGLEQALVDDEDGAQIAELTLALEMAWDNFAQRIVPVLGDDIGERFEVTRAELDELRGATKPFPELAKLVERIEHEPVRMRLVRASEQLTSLSQRLGKADVDYELSAEGVRLASARFAPFWVAFAHVVRNVADHGLHTREERESLGKPPHNRVELTARQVGGNVVVEVADDGRGVDWEKVRVRAQKLGLRHETRADLVAALFAPGLSTAEELSSTSGRGVGMSAVAEACRALGGTFTLESELGKGTRMSFTLPITSAERPEPRPRLSMAPVTIPPRRNSHRPLHHRPSAPPPAD
ncbi:MAG TPA: nitrate- and nitrite sensing domain-containing protein [Polyangiaceae bacterium]|nr:nitrate- and nitrite sensing domain-containing protein [Polyangiaceae bacterium]